VHGQEAESARQRVPQSRGWRRDPPYRGGWREIFSQYRKEGRAIRNLLEKVFGHFIPLYNYFFTIGEAIGKLMKLL
jgi:hypothetical protein